MTSKQLLQKKSRTGSVIYCEYPIPLISLQFYVLQIIKFIFYLSFWESWEFQAKVTSCIFHLFNSKTLFLRHDIFNLCNRASVEVFLRDALSPLLSLTFILIISAVVPMEVVFSSMLMTLPSLQDTPLWL